MNRPTPEDRELLTDSVLLRGLPPEDASEILDRSTLRTSDPGDALFRQGESIDGLYLLADGRVKLSQLGVGGEEVIIRIVTPGEVFAAVAALDRVQAFPVSATAMTPARVAFWERAAIREIFAEHPTLAAALLQEIADRAQEMQTRFRQVATERVPQRLAAVLLRLVERSGRERGKGVVIDFPLARQDLAEMAGTTLYTVSRLLNEWAEQGVVEVSRQEVAVLSRERLRELAEE